jgi:nicotinamide-nucleotide amidase
VGESNVDRAIGDLMTTQNPTIGLAAHAGQTDVRITAKADSEAEAESLIASVEAKVRQRLGVAIYGTEKETVPEVIGGLLVEKNLKLGVIDTLTGGRITRQLADAGFGDRLATDLHTDDIEAVYRKADLTFEPDARDDDCRSHAVELARYAAPPGGIGFALVGPFENHSTYIALSGPEHMRLAKAGRNYQNSAYIRSWLAIQGLDWIRRAVLGQLVSPADWEEQKT